MTRKHERPQLEGAKGAVADAVRQHHSTTPSRAGTIQPVPCLLWGWPEVLRACSIPRRTLEREIAASRFPKPVRRIGRRPFWKPTDIIRWAEGGRS
jgi:predicted DNA-binding transcriptional regulator AlpA